MYKRIEIDFQHGLVGLLLQHLADLFKSECPCTFQENGLVREEIPIIMRQEIGGGFKKCFFCLKLPFLPGDRLSYSDHPAYQWRL